MVCLSISLGGLFPCRLKRFVAIASSPNRPYTSSSHNTSPEGSGSSALHRSHLVSHASRPSSIMELPSPPASYVSASSKPVADECERTPPLPWPYLALLPRAPWFASRRCFAGERYSFTMMDIEFGMFSDHKQRAIHLSKLHWFNHNTYSVLAPLTYKKKQPDTYYPKNCQGIAN